MSSPDIRRQVLVKKVQQKLRLGSVTVSYVKEDINAKKNTDVDDSVQIITDSNDNESLSLEERETSTKMHNVNTKTDESTPVEAKAEPKPVEATVTKEKNIEIQWLPVKRNKRKTRLFLFGAPAKGEADEVFVVSGENNQKIPRIINGRRPHIVVPGVEYDLEEGEGVMLDTEEEETEIRLARNEKYEMDSFVCDTGYLSDEEMVETPSVDKVASKVKQQRRANNIQAKLKFEKIGEPLVLGCLWWSGKGGQKQKMKKWQALVFTNTPIQTSYTTPVPKEQCSPQPPPPLPPAPANTFHSSNPTTDFTVKYHIKYLVKHLVQQSMQTKAGPAQCSTPMPGQQISRHLPATPSGLTQQMMEQGDILSENREIVDRYVAKYFNKYKYCI